MTTTTELATLAGGCFWCTEAIFTRLTGVISVTPGYTGGTKENPSYDDVCTGKTGHAEAIQISFDPSIISYETLLTIFWHLHDPTTPNQQGADHGTQYRSAIFYHTDKQKQIAENLMMNFEQSHTFKAPIVTEITPAGPFFSAEQYHQRYYERNGNQGYCQVVIDPKVQKLLKEFRKEVKQEYQKW
jgi:peptide-methionine (S)-S-oxide reductase